MSLHLCVRSVMLRLLFDSSIRLTQNAHGELVLHLSHVCLKQEGDFVFAIDATLLRVLESPNQRKTRPLIILHV